MTLAFVDTNSKLLDVASVADVDAEELVDNSLVVILNLNFGDDVKQRWNLSIPSVPAAV